ncbi:hypothetical protein [Streptomyces sp. NBC_01235]|uniref:hypothetical protein n=1 Tax=Streptomyces sp. NBC_01235 TaxID=2903788 RepID=UPI002E0DECB3|nr:hypothetical protein OG289_17320 [Streptomyces sp. NBC_01235]
MVTVPDGNGSTPDSQGRHPSAAPAALLHVLFAPPGEIIKGIVRATEVDGPEARLLLAVLASGGSIGSGFERGCLDFDHLM